MLLLGRSLVRLRHCCFLRGCLPYPCPPPGHAWGHHVYTASLSCHRVANETHGLLLRTLTGMRYTPLSLTQMRLECPLSVWCGDSGRCQWCNETINDPRRSSYCSKRCASAWDREHVWRHARAAVKRRADYRCSRPGCTAQRRDCEVNHREPRNGQGYLPGCHHHTRPDEHGVGGLEVLCHAHHVEVTSAQASARAASRRAQKS